MSNIEYPNPFSQIFIPFLLTSMCNLYGLNSSCVYVIENQCKYSYSKYFLSNNIFILETEVLFLIPLLSSMNLFFIQDKTSTNRYILDSDFLIKLKLK